MPYQKILGLLYGFFISGVSRTLQGQDSEGSIITGGMFLIDGAIRSYILHDELNAFADKGIIPFVILPGALHVSHDNKRCNPRIITPEAVFLLVIPQPVQTLVNRFFDPLLKFSIPFCPC